MLCRSGLCCPAVVQNTRGSLCIWFTRVQRLQAGCMGPGLRKPQTGREAASSIYPAGTSTSSFPRHDFASDSDHPFNLLYLFSIVCFLILQPHSFLNGFSCYLSLGWLLSPGSPGASQGLWPGTSDSY